MLWDEDLNERKKTILRSIVDDYVNTAQPVGSRTISRKRELGLSSATIRNEMADLEELGYIAQPHTSAGRVPSDKGYRFYVDNLVQVHALANEELLRIRATMEERIGELNELVRRANSLISALTGYATVAITPKIESTFVRAVQLVPIGGRRVLLVVIVSGGVISSRVVWLNADINPDKVIQISNYLTRHFESKHAGELTIKFLAEMEFELRLPDGVALPIAEGLNECMRRVSHTEIMLDGMTNLLNYPEFRDLLKARELIDLLNEEEVLSGLLNDAGNKTGTEVRIGAENSLGSFRELSLVTTSYGGCEHRHGAIGVIGPTRMTYSRVIATIDSVKKLLDIEIIRLLRD